MTHGKASTYASGGCRCSPCRAAHAARILKEQHNRASAVDQNAGTFKHGRSGYSNHRCRCDVCTDGHREYMNAYKARKRAALQQGYRPEP